MSNFEASEYRDNGKKGFAGNYGELQDKGLSIDQIRQIALDRARQQADKDRSEVIHASMDDFSYLQRKIIPRGGTKNIKIESTESIDINTYNAKNYSSLINGDNIFPKVQTDKIHTIQGNNTLVTSRINENNQEEKVVIQGNFLDGLTQGKAAIVWENGRKYVGYTLNGERSGLGVQVESNNGNTFEGLFFKDQIWTGVLRDIKGQVVARYENGKQKDTPQIIDTVTNGNELKFLQQHKTSLTQNGFNIGQDIVPSENSQFRYLTLDRSQFAYQIMVDRKSYPLERDKNRIPIYTGSILGWDQNTHTLTIKYKGQITTITSTKEIPTEVPHFTARQIPQDITQSLNKFGFNVANGMNTGTYKTHAIISPIDGYSKYKKEFDGKTEYSSTNIILDGNIQRIEKIPSTDAAKFMIRVYSNNQPNITYTFLKN